MIEKLKKKDIRKAAIVYNKGLRMEIPRGKSTLKRTTTILSKEEECLVYKEGDKIIGLVTFEKKGKNIKIRFICTLKLRKGIGKKLMICLARIAIKREIKYLFSNVSTKDKRVIKFYDYCGFKKYDSYEAERGFILNKIKVSLREVLSYIS